VNEASPGSLFEPDADQIRLFASAIFLYADANTFVSLRTFADDKASKSEPIYIEGCLAGSEHLVSRMVDRAKQAARHKSPAVFCVLPATFFKERSAKKSDIANGLVIVADCDQNPTAAREMLSHLLGVPTVTVESGGIWTNPGTGEIEPKLHLYWRLSEPTTDAEGHGQLAVANRLAATLVNSDSTAIFVGHPLRCPGSWHCKTGTSRMCRIVKVTANETELPVALELLREAVGDLDADGGEPPTPGENLSGELAEIERALAAIPNDDLDWAKWNKVGLATWRASDGKGFAAFDRWSRKSAKYDAAETQARWEHFGEYPPDTIGMGSLIYWVRQGGVDPSPCKPADTERPNGPDRPPGADRESATTPGAPHPSMHDEIVPVGDRIDHDQGRGGDGAGDPYPDPGSDPEQRPPPPERLPSPARPLVVAGIFLKMWFTRGATRTLHYWRGSWWHWRGAHWIEIEERVVRALLYAFTSRAIYVDAKDEVKPWSPDRKKVSDLTDALSAITILSSECDQPSWLDGRDAGVIVSVTNGLLDVTTRKLQPHTPVYFNASSVPFRYDPAAPPPTQWLAFLEELWPGDKAPKDAIGEWFGYVISGRLDLHKILLMVGPTRGGKGVIARILIALVGEKNTAGPTLSSLGGEFGLAPLLGKSLAVIADVRFVAKESGAIVERLLSISGEDVQTVNRKYREQWTGKLPARLHVISNELPRLGDASTAIVGRIVLLLLSHSWLGNEDHGLEPRLRSELTGILNWGLDGLQRLTVTNKNHFTATEGAEEAINTMRDLASPARAFVRERCKLGPEEQAECDGLYKSFREWCDDAGLPKPAKHVFGRDLRAAVPSIKVARPRDADGKPGPRVYIGISFKGA
jgi:putative DNA primase/helicase